MQQPTGPGGAGVPDTLAPSLKAPPLVRRMAAWLYEGLLLFGVLVAASAIFSIPLGYRGAPGDPLQLAYAAWLFCVLAAYFVWFWSKGQTLAMKSWQIRVVDRTGAPLRRSRAFLRYVFAWMWFVPIAAALKSRQFSLGQLMVVALGWIAVWALLSRFHPQRQFWHDALAGTRLVAQPPRPEG